MVRIVDGLWSWLNTNAGAVSTVATVITALVAVLALRATARDSRDRTRAYVAVDLVPATRSRSSAVLRVRNFGQSVARDVQLTFTPPLSPRARNDTVAPVERRYRDTIPNLSPGQELKNTWQTWTDSGTLSSAPERCTVRVTYRSGRARRRLSEQFVLDVRVIGAESDPIESDSELGTMRRIATSLESVARNGR